MSRSAGPYCRWAPRNSGALASVLSAVGAKMRSMAAATLQVSDRFPAGTKVEVFTRATAGEPRSDARRPHSDPAATATVDRQGVLEVDGLDANVMYTATAMVEDQRRFVDFSAK